MKTTTPIFDILLDAGPAGLSTPTLAERTGQTEALVRRQCHDLRRRGYDVVNVCRQHLVSSPASPVKRSSKTGLVLACLVERPHSISEIAERIGCSATTVDNAIRALRKDHGVVVESRSVYVAHEPAVSAFPLPGPEVEPDDALDIVLAASIRKAEGEIEERRTMLSAMRAPPALRGAKA